MTEVFQPSCSFCRREHSSNPTWQVLPHPCLQAQLEQRGVQQRPHKPAPFSCFLWFPNYCSGSTGCSQGEAALKTMTKKILPLTEVNKVLWRVFLFHSLIFETNCPGKVSEDSLHLKTNSKSLHNFKTFKEMQHMDEILFRWKDKKARVVRDCLFLLLFIRIPILFLCSPVPFYYKKYNNFWS